MVDFSKLELNKLLKKMQQPKGCRVTIKVEEPGFSDARVMLKFPWEGMPNVIINPGVSYTFVLKGHIANQVVIEGLPREGDPEDPDMEGGAHGY